jgi:hypothetical protein
MSACFLTSLIYLTHQLLNSPILTNALPENLLEITGSKGSITVLSECAV